MLHKILKSIGVGALLILPSASAFAQLPVNGFYSNKGDLTLAVSYSNKSADDFYVGPDLAGAIPAELGEISSDIISIYAQYGISDTFSAIVTLPYISVESEAGVADPVNGTSTVDGLQDLGLSIKGKILEKDFGGAGDITLGAAGGVSFPISDYAGGGILSIGNQATAITGEAIFQYNSPFKVFTELQLGYSTRSSDEFDVPDALLYSAKIGYIHKYFYIHSQFTVHDSTDGVDILGEGFSGPEILPETEVDYKILSFSLYVPVYEDKIGVSLGYETTVDGRNFNDESGIGFGLVYCLR